MNINSENVSRISGLHSSDSARQWSQDICQTISQIVLKNFIKIILIITECPEEILIKLAIVPARRFRSLAETLMFYIFFSNIILITLVK